MFKNWAEFFLPLFSAKVLKEFFFKTNMNKYRRIIDEQSVNNTTNARCTHSRPEAEVFTF